MSMRPVTAWTVQCDGDMPHGRVCPAIVLSGHPHVRATDHTWDAGPLLDAGWVLLGDRHLCPDHVAAAETHAAAALDGLPFDDHRTQTDKTEANDA